MLKFAVFVRTPSRCSLLPELNGDHVSLLYTFQNTSVQAIEAARTRQDRATRQPHQARAAPPLRSAASEERTVPLIPSKRPRRGGGDAGATRGAARRRAEPGSRGLTRTVVSRHTRRSTGTASLRDPGPTRGRREYYGFVRSAPDGVSGRAPALQLRVVSVSADRTPPRTKDDAPRTRNTGPVGRRDVENTTRTHGTSRLVSWLLSHRVARGCAAHDTREKL